MKPTRWRRRNDTIIKLLILAVIYASDGFILGRSKILYTYDFLKEKFLIESLIGFLIQAPPVILKNNRQQ